MSSDPPVPPGIPGDVGELTMVQGNFSAIANAASWIAQQIDSANGQVVWSGAAHDAFQTVLEDVPSDLQKIQASFSKAAGALQTYLSQLPELQSGYQRSLYQYVQLWEHQQQLSNQLSNATPGFLGGSPSPQHQAEVNSLQHQIDGNTAELNRLYGTLVDLYGEAKSAANQLASALEAASIAGIQDNLGNTWGRYSGDVTGFVGGVVTGIAHDVEECVAAVLNLCETLEKMENDIARGDWAAAGKDADQLLLDVNDICRSLSNILMTLTPLLQFIPGVGEVVDILDVIAVVATAATFATDAAMIGTGGTAVDPLTGAPVDLRKQGEQSIVGDFVGLALSVLPGGGGVADDAAHDAGRDALEEPIEAKTVAVDAAAEGGDAIRAGEDTGEVLARTGGTVSFGGPEPEVTTMSQALGGASWNAVLGISPASGLSDIVHFRQTVSDSIDRFRVLSFENPEVFNHFGIKLGFREFTRVSAAVRGARLGFAVHQDMAQPTGQNAETLFDTAGDPVTGVVP